MFIVVRNRWGHRKMCLFFYIIVQHPVFLFHYIQFIIHIHNWRWYSEKLHCTYPIHHGPMNPLCDDIIHVWRNIIMLCIYALHICYHALDSEFSEVIQQLSVKNRPKELNKMQCVNAILKYAFTQIKLLKGGTISHE